MRTYDGVKRSYDSSPSRPADTVASHNKRRRRRVGPLADEVVRLDGYDQPASVFFDVAGR